MSRFCTADAMTVRPSHLVPPQSPTRKTFSLKTNTEKFFFSFDNATNTKAHLELDLESLSRFHNEPDEKPM